MEQVAVFVDAGYLFKQGSAALTGSARERRLCKLTPEIVCNFLREETSQRSPGRRLLRIYWYDGAGPTGATPQQREIANRNDVKLRLGVMNAQSQQKGVDSLIVTDMIELARNKAITDAVLLSGDEDIRVGVQLAQNFGVRVHLLGIFPARSSQSPLLVEECDTVGEWEKEKVSEFLTVAIPESNEEASSTSQISQEITDCADSFLRSLPMEDRTSLRQKILTDGDFVPREFDGKLLASAGRALDRWLDEPEKRALRADLVRLAKI